MGTWVLHIVGQSDDADLQEAVTKFVDDLKAVGQSLTSASLTTDDAAVELDVTPASDVSEDTPPTLAAPLPSWAQNDPPVSSSS